MDPTVFVEGRPDVVIVWARLEDAWERGVIPLVEGDTEESLGRFLRSALPAR